MAPTAFSGLCAGLDLFPSLQRGFVPLKMGANYTKYCHVSSMLKYPVDSFNETANRREELHGKADFTLIVKGTQFQVHKEVLMKSSRYYLTLIKVHPFSGFSFVDIVHFVDSSILSLF